MFKKVIFFILITNTVLLAEIKSGRFQFSDPKYDYYAKNAMMAGAVTATAVGYSSLYVNPAGLAYASTSIEYNSGARGAGGTYGNFAASAKDVYSIGAGYEMFGIAIGATYIYDEQDIDENPVDYSPGNHYIVGVKYTYTYTDMEDMWRISFGSSFKSSGKNESEDSNIIYISPQKINIGMSISTNIGYTSTILFSEEYKMESFQSIDDEISTTASGVKWMYSPESSKLQFAVANGYSYKEYKNNTTFKAIKEATIGVELGYGSLGMNISYGTKVTLRNDSTDDAKESYTLIDVYYLF